MYPAFDSERYNSIYLVDTVDYDMFLRARN
jgi:hypothetical protein